MIVFMTKELTAMWAQWFATDCLRINVKKWAKHGVNLPLILKDQWEKINQICSQNPDSDDARIMQEGVIHSICTLAEAKVGNYENDEAIIAETAELGLRVQYMINTDQNNWETESWIDFINKSKEAGK